VAALTPAPVKTRVAWFQVTNPSGQTTRADLLSFPFTIGRQSDNQLVLRDNRVSRVHARIEQDAGDYWIRDCESRHGTYVNGEKLVERRRLRPEDRVTFGFDDGYALVFHVQRSELPGLMAQVSAPAQAGGAGANLAKLRSLLEVARALQGSLTTAEVLEAVVDAALAVTGCERGFLLLKEEKTAGAASVAGGLYVHVARDRNGAQLNESDLRVPRSVIERALAERRELLSMNFDPNEGIETGQSIAALELRSAVCVPLVRVRTGSVSETVAISKGDTAGLIYLDSRTGLADLSSGNRELLQTLAIEASTILENARLLEKEREQMKMAQEMEIAREIQRSLLPRELPREGLLRVAGSSISNLAVGGDFFDVVRLDGGGYALAVADVSGKGVSSALLASFLQGVFLQAPRDAASIRAMLAHLNRHLLDRTRGEKYATVFYMAVEPDGTLHWSNAGHCEPRLLRARGGVDRLRATSLPVGMIEDAAFEAVTQKVEKGDTIIVFSDGLSEARSPRGDYFEGARLKQVLDQAGTLGAEALHASILEAVRTFTEGMEQRDDITLVVAEFQPEP
jgi:serine phosphatase RsbU (regulator of sigma subunit)